MTDQPLIDKATMYGAGSTMDVLGTASIQVGLQSDPLKRPADGLPPGMSIRTDSAGQKYIHIVDDNLRNPTQQKLIGYDLTGYYVTVHTNGITIENCLFDGSGQHTVRLYEGYNDLTVRYCTFIGSAGEITAKDAHFGFVAGQGRMEVTNNEFINAYADAVNTVGGVVSQNYFSGAGYQTGAHADAISVEKTIAPVLISQNYVDSRDTADNAVVPNATIKIAAHFGEISGVTVEDNLLLGGSYPVYVQYREYQTSDVAILNNAIGLSYWEDIEGNESLLYDIYLGANENRINGIPTPDPDKGNLPPDTIYALNERVRLTTDPTTGDPILTHDTLWRSIGSLSNESGASILTDTDGTNSLSGGSSRDFIRGLWGNDTVDGGGGNDILNGGIGNDSLNGGAGTDDIVGGWGQDTLTGGADGDLFSFFYASDSKVRAADLIADFQSGIDKLDLSGMDAIPAAPGDQAFVVIGSSAFSGTAGELRYTYNARSNITTIEGNLDANKTADFQVQVRGQIRLDGAQAEWDLIL